MKTLKSLICAFAMFAFSAIGYTQNPNSNPNAQGQWKLTGNNTDTNKFVGTTNDVDLVFKRNNIESFRLLEDTAAKFSGDVFLDKFKEKPPINSGPPKEVFLKVDNQGKIISTDKSGLLKSIYTSPSTCLPTGINSNVVGLPIWSATSTSTYGILYTGIDCPARVGIGTNNPVSTLQVVGNGFFQGNLGVNVAPTTINTLSIVNPVNRTGILLQNNHPTSITLKYGIKNEANNPNTIAYSVTDQSTNQDVFRVMGDGQVWATEINVALATDFPDYVFAPDYFLMPLDQLESYIEQNKHLPNIPAATEIKENGLELGKMQVKQMEKIEELTLYLIEIKKELEILKLENKKLKEMMIKN